MTSKVKTLWAAIIAGVTGLIAFLANTPPEQQDAVLGPFVAFLPVSWRPSIALFCRAISGAAGIYAAIHASHSGPQTPPKNPPTA